MSSIRSVKTILKSQPTLEGAGVRLVRAFSHNETELFDPFLLFDDFHSSNPDDYIAGFPWHPHRGIETVSYVLEGQVLHGDSMKNSGAINSGDLQWMTAGSGIIHQEMPKGDKNGRMAGFQLWVNLPAKQKMMSPRYQEIKNAQIPLIQPLPGILIRVISGQFQNTKGPISQIVAEPSYFDISLEPHTSFDIPVTSGHTVFAYVFQGEILFGSTQQKPIEESHTALFNDGDCIRASAKGNPGRFLLISGKPIKEPVAWAGPIVMNTQKELDIAFREYEEGTFIK